MWEDAEPFNNQEGFNAKELFYINELLKLGFEVRFNETHILHKETFVISIQRINLAIKNPFTE